MRRRPLSRGSTGWRTPARPAAISGRPPPGAPSTEPPPHRSEAAECEDGHAQADEPPEIGAEPQQRQATAEEAGGQGQGGRPRQQRADDANHPVRNREEPADEDRDEEHQGHGAFSRPLIEGDDDQDEEPEAHHTTGHVPRRRSTVHEHRPRRGVERGPRRVRGVHGEERVRTSGIGERRHGRVAAARTSPFCARHSTLASPQPCQWSTRTQQLTRGRSRTGYGAPV